MTENIILNQSAADAILEQFEKTWSGGDKEDYQDFIDFLNSLVSEDAQPESSLDGIVESIAVWNSDREKIVDKFLADKDKKEIAKRVWNEFMKSEYEFDKATYEWELYYQFVCWIE